MTIEQMMRNLHDLAQLKPVPAQPLPKRRK
jgi:hypothetical protein